MRHLKLQLILRNLMLGVACLVSGTLWAGTAEVTWHQPEKYSDIQVGEGVQSAFQEQILKGLEQYIEDLAGQLPADYQLQMTVTDVNLAGEVELQPYEGGLRLLRIIRNADFPSMKFSYQLNNAEGEQIMAGEERIRGRVLPGQGRLNARNRHSNEQLEYEQAMLSRWFLAQFENEIEKAKENRSQN